MNSGAVYYCRLCLMLCFVANGAVQLSNSRCATDVQPFSRRKGYRCTCTDTLYFCKNWLIVRKFLTGLCLYTAVCTNFRQGGDHGSFLPIYTCSVLHRHVIHRHGPYLCSWPSIPYIHLGDTIDTIYTCKMDDNVAVYRCVETIDGYHR